MTTWTLDHATNYNGVYLHSDDVADDVLDEINDNHTDPLSSYTYDVSYIEKNDDAHFIGLSKTEIDILLEKARDILRPFVGEVTVTYVEDSSST